MKEITFDENIEMAIQSLEDTHNKNFSRTSKYGEIYLNVAIKYIEAARKQLQFKN